MWYFNLIFFILFIVVILKMYQVANDQLFLIIIFKLKSFTTSKYEHSNKNFYTFLFWSFFYLELKILFDRRLILKSPNKIKTLLCKLTYTKWLKCTNTSCFFIMDQFKNKFLLLHTTSLFFLLLNSANPQDQQTTPSFH